MTAFGCCCVGYSFHCRNFKEYETGEDRNKADRRKSRAYTDTTTTITDLQQQQQLTQFKNLLTEYRQTYNCLLTCLHSDSLARQYVCILIYFYDEFLAYSKKKKFVISLDLLFSYVQSLSSAAFCFLPSSYPLPHPSPIGFH